MKTPILLLIALPGLLLALAGLTASDSATSPPHGIPGMEQAESLFAEGSFAMAHEIYERLDALPLDADAARWVDFRLADSAWRAAAAADSADTTALDAAREDLERLVRDIRRDEQRDLVWVEVTESLGDYWWTRRNTRNWGQAWQNYRQALDWWAGSTDVERARGRYLEIVWRAVRPPHAEPYYYYGYYGNQLPLDVLENARRIAADTGDRAHADYLVGMALRYQGATRATHERTRAAFEAAIAAGTGTDWYDDALFHYAEWLAQSGRLVRNDGGGWSAEPDFAAALRSYRRLVAAFADGASRHRPQALARIEQITASALSVVVPHFHAPGDKIEFALRRRNVAQVRFRLYAVSLLEDPRLSGDDTADGWLEGIDIAGRDPVRSWTVPLEDHGEHREYDERLALEPTPPPGAYLLEVRSGPVAARDLVLVTDAALLLESFPDRILAYACNAADGAPLEDAEVHLRRRIDQGGRTSWKTARARTGPDGTATFDVAGEDSHQQIFAAATRGAHAALALGWGRFGDDAATQWKIYAFTDRPAYRPGETARWKAVARVERDGTQRTPSGARLGYEIVDPRGTKVDEGEIELNAFGSGWGSLELGAAFPLGEYRVTFRSDGRHVGSATLFRVEEYKLPEFRVDVEPDGTAPARPGDRIGAQVVAEYYFGGPVVGAEIEVLVYRKPLYVRWVPPREFPWLFEAVDGRLHRGWGGGSGELVHRETLRSGPDGRALVEFDAATADLGDFEYTIEARVTDASRREVAGRGTLRVSRQRYFAFLNSNHRLYRPGDRVRVEVRTLDADERPLAAEGRVRVTRDRWVEVWADPAGRRIDGPALDKLRRKGSFPPAAGRDTDFGWRRISAGYEAEEVLSRVMRTGAEGTAEVQFDAERPGFYRVAWSGDRDALYPVGAETTVWVADRSSTDLGYRHGGLEILVDADSAAEGRTLPVLLHAPVGDAWVLFTVEGGGLREQRVVHMRGNVELLELDVDAGWIPNVHLQAAMVHARELFVDTRQVVVPPQRQFLDVQVEADRETYEPGEPGHLTVTARDLEGRPVAAEVALALVDRSVFAIQEPYAADPRAFFYGNLRPDRSVLHSSFQQKSFPQESAAPDDADSPPMPVAMIKASAERTDAGFAKDEARGRAMGRMAPAEESAAVAGADVTVRSDFRATAFWQPDVVTGPDGTARVEVTFPDSLTTWEATARAATEDSRFGSGSGEARTTRPLIVRLQAPRFFVVGDRTTISAVVNNHTEIDQTASVTLVADGLVNAGEAVRHGVEVPAGGEARVDWVVDSTTAGTAQLQVSARSSRAGDAMRRTFPVFEHGVDKLVSRSGKLRDERHEFTLELPAQRRHETTALTLTLAPSLAVTMLDALPYLIDYPYGCTEQTMSRFLPTTIVVRTLAGLGLDPGDVAGRAFGGIEAQHTGTTQRGGPRELERMQAMTRDGLRRLYDFQHADGGWGWWKQGASDPFMSAYVVWGLGLARDAGVDVDAGALRRGLDFLDRRLVEAEEQPDVQAWMLHAVSAADGAGRGQPARFRQAALDNLWDRREGLGAYPRALLALAAHAGGDGERARVLARNLANGVSLDRRPDVSAVSRSSGSSQTGVAATAHWGRSRGWRLWSDGAVEATAFALRALVAIEPGHELIEPAMHWLVRNRRGAQWSNTRDTAIAVLALSDYLRVSGELGSDVGLTLTVNGREIAAHTFAASDGLPAPARFDVDPDLLRDGVNSVRIVRTRGDGPIYYAAEARFFSLEEPVTAAGNEIFVRRQYLRLAARPTLLRGHVFERVPLDDGEHIASGDRVEVVLTVEAKNDYEYLVFEDLKPAGLEAVEVRSGDDVSVRELKAPGAERSEAAREPTDYTGRSRAVHRELRDRKVALFVDKLPQGIWELRYELRAEVPGSFHALPALGHAMYVPEIRCNGEEVRIHVDER